MEPDRRTLLANIPGVQIVQPQVDPDLPPCPLCGAPALKGKGFRHPADIEHDCDCIYLHPEEYGAAVLRAWRLYTAPRLLLQDHNLIQRIASAVHSILHRLEAKPVQVPEAA